MTDTQRTHDLWPAGHRAALLLVLQVSGVADSATSESGTGYLTGVDYTATGLQRLITALADLDIAATTAWTAAGLETSPQLVRVAADHGHEIAVSVTGKRASDLAELRDTASRLSGAPITGFAEIMASADDESSAVDAGYYSGFSWSLTRQGGDVPVMRSATDDAPAHITLPASPFWTDAIWLNPVSPQPPSSFLETLSLGLQSVRTINGLMTVIIHPHISGRPGFAETIVRFIDEAIGSGDVWIPRASELADWWRKRQTDPSEVE